MEIAYVEYAAREAGNLVMNLRGKVDAEYKGYKDVVTQADRESQKLLIELLLDKFPSTGYIGEEEGGENINPDAKLKWVVDPIDGTINYARGLPMFNISIALASFARGTPTVEMGVVYAPALDQMYTATLNGGAFLVEGNEEKTIHVSERANIETCLLASHPKSAPLFKDGEAGWFENMRQFESFRYLGSGALELCQLASGQIDAFVVNNQMPYDYAAGSLIVHEAGGIVTTHKNTSPQLEKTPIVAANNPWVHEAVMRYLR